MNIAIFVMYFITDIHENIMKCDFLIQVDCSCLMLYPNIKPLSVGKKIFLYPFSLLNHNYSNYGNKRTLNFDEKKLLWNKSFNALPILKTRFKYAHEIYIVWLSDSKCQLAYLITSIFIVLARSLLIKMPKIIMYNNFS